MQVFILTYHSTNIFGNTYQTNDLVAFRSDLQLFKELCVEIISTHDLVAWLKGKKSLDPDGKYVALTFDDGCELDYYDWQHPTHGYQQSFYTSMKTYDGKIHATSFVIASDKARMDLVNTCTAGFEIWGDQWWQEAENSGLFSVENHSWDHLHATLLTVKQKNNLKGDFTKIDNLSDANTQIKEASGYINSRVLNKRTTLFAYPYGHYNDYLTREYFPIEQNEISAAFTCGAEPVIQNTNLWKVPRYVCGLDWKTSLELTEMLNT
ncbi:MAG: polysaccharide deacetylase family protein [Proteobacteria bacterium]|nr:polysaccharide deacetylase family protein [Pseudomonadota bacterium]